MFYPQIFNPVFEETSKLLTHPRMFVTITGLFSIIAAKEKERGSHQLDHTFLPYQPSRDRLEVRTLRCGRNNPGSNPGHGNLLLFFYGTFCSFLLFIFVNVANLKKFYQQDSTLASFLRLNAHNYVHIIHDPTHNYTYQMSFLSLVFCSSERSFWRDCAELNP